MPLSNLARVFAPTVVGCGPNPASMKSCVVIMEALLNAPNEFYAQVLNEGVEADGGCLRTGGGSIYANGQRYQTLNRLR